MFAAKKSIVYSDVNRAVMPTPTGVGPRYGGPTPHKVFIQTLRTVATARGWGMGDTATGRYGLAEGGLTMACAHTIAPAGVPTPDRATLAMGWVHSNSRHYRLRAYLGCMTKRSGIVMFEYKSRFRPGTMPLEKIITHTMARMNRDVATVPVVVARLREAEVNAVTADRTMVAAGRRGAMPWSRVGRADAHWHKNNRERTAWGLCLSLAAGTAMSPVMRQMAEMYELFKLVDVGLGADAEAA